MKDELAINYLKVLYPDLESMPRLQRIEAIKYKNYILDNIDDVDAYYKQLINVRHHNQRYSHMSDKELLEIIFKSIEQKKINAFPTDADKIIKGEVLVDDSNKEEENQEAQQQEEQIEENIQVPQPQEEIKEEKEQVQMEEKEEVVIEEKPAKVKDELNNLSAEELERLLEKTVRENQSKAKELTDLKKTDLVKKIRKAQQEGTELDRLIAEVKGKMTENN